ncbi:MAG: AbgT family transporter [Pyramidobacter sp.]|nr:AbgT family transporter [Pyramidobacter sp.]
MTEKKRQSEQKKKFKMPHLLWLMLGLLLFSSLLTYVIPAGQFGKTASGALDGTKFSYLGYQTPVNLLRSLLSIFPGLTGSASIIMIVMICGACMQVFLDTKTFDRLLDWTIYKTEGKSDTLLISTLFCMMVYLGGFGGSDALIAVVPIGIAFARKMRLDAISAIGVTTFATLIGFGTGPTKMYVIQGLMGTRLYGGFMTRFLILNVFMLLGLLMLLRYVRRIRRDPLVSLKYQEEPLPGADVGAEGGGVPAAVMDWKIVINMFLFIGQFVLITVYGLMSNDYNMRFSVQAATMMVVALVQGKIAGMSADELGDSFAKGLASMAFVVFVIGLARSVSIVLSEDNVLHTIVYALTRPLMDLPRWVASIGMMLIIAVINPIIPSATSKGAILVPIIKPIGEVLGLAPELVVQAFQFGDGFTNIISPILGWTVGSLAMVKVSFPRWFEWAFGKVLAFIGVAALLMFLFTISGWTFAL